MKAAPQLVLMLFVLVGIAAANASEGAAQSIPAADAQAFLGEWNLPLQADQPVTLELNIRDASGQVEADVTAMGTTSRITKISKSGENLVLGYDFDIGGQVAPITIRLTPAGETLSAAVDVADGMFTTSGTAARK